MRRKLTKAERREVYDKMNGHCTYCGSELTMENMTADHIVPLANGGGDTIDNMMPACRSCNHYKSTMTLERFRDAVERFPSVLARDSVTYRNAVRFGVVKPNPHKVKFYFENMYD